MLARSLRLNAIHLFLSLILHLGKIFLIVPLHLSKRFISFKSGFDPSFFSSRRRHTRYWRDWSSDVCSSDLSASIAMLVNVIAPITTEPGGPAWRQATYFPFAVTSRLAQGVALDVRVEAGSYDTEIGRAPCRGRV